MYKILLSVAVMAVVSGNAQASDSALDQLRSFAGPALEKCVSSDDIVTPEIKELPLPAEDGQEYASRAAEPKNYFPFDSSLVLVYSYTTSEQAVAETIELTFENISLTPKERMGVGRLAISGKIRPDSFRVRQTEQGIFAFDYANGRERMEFPFPIKENARWESSVGIESIATLRGWVIVPAGKFYGVLKVVTSLGGGDLGTATRYYAPGVGLVYEEILAEDKHDVLKLVAVRRK